MSRRAKSAGDAGSRVVCRQPLFRKGQPQAEVAAKVGDGGTVILAPQVGQIHAELDHLDGIRQVDREMPDSWASTSVSGISKRSPSGVPGRRS